MSRPELCWVIEEGEALTLAALLERSHADPSALADGRVFVDARRTTDENLTLAAGQRVELYTARQTSGELRVLARLEGLMVVDKPAGMATEPDHRGIAGSVVALAAELASVAREQVHAASRLDVGVSGVVLLALDGAARRLVAELRQSGRLRRRYVAIAAAAPQAISGEWHGAIGRGGGSRRKLGGDDAQPALTRFAVVARTPQAALLALEPVTGRTHQLRVHAAGAGAPLFGDGLYGGPRRVTSRDGSVTELRRIALHAAWVELPFAGRLRIESALPAELCELWRLLEGGDEELAPALADPSVLAT